VTDGISEAKLTLEKDEKELGMQGLIGIAQRQKNLSAIKVVEQIMNLIQRQKMKVDDDATILVIKKVKNADEKS